MKKAFSYFLPALAIFIFVVILLAETFVVKVQTTNLRKEPKFYSSSIASLKAGEVLEKISEQEGWIRVRTSAGLEGWVHSSALQQRKFTLLAMDKSLKTQASAEEVALAGKGFNKQVEEEYRSRHGEISFAWVEKMLQMKVTPEEIQEFLKRGRLAEFGGEK